MLAFLAGFAMVVALWIGYSMILSYPAMLLFGIIHGFLPIIPAFGFGQTLAIVMLCGILFGKFSATSD